MKHKYHRLYCKNCKLIYGTQNIGLLNCTKCGSPLIFKSFNPWLRTIGGALIIFFGMLTLTIEDFPIIWIGGFLWGASLIIISLKQWQDIKKIDTPQYSSTMESQPKEDENYITITCGNCGSRFSVRRGQGIIEKECPKCLRKSRIST